MRRVALLSVLACLQACALGPTRSVHGTAPGSEAAPRPEPAAVDPDPAARERAAEPLGPPGEEEEYYAPAPVGEPRTAQPEPGPVQPERPPHPLADVSDEELEQMLLEDPASLGSVSVGRTSAGALFNAVQMPTGPHWKIVNPRQTWGTRETVDAIARCIEHVARQFPDTRPVYLGDISERNGGRIDSHLSHQSGRDADIGYYYTIEHEWYRHAHRGNLDLPRTWALVRALITRTDVQRIFIDHRIQKLLKQHALSIGEDPAWLDSIFGGELSDDRPLIMHEDGHATHLHVRFYNPVAQKSGRRLYSLLIEHDRIEPPVYYVRHEVEPGDTLIGMARKYRTSVRTIKRANSLRSNRIYAGRTYKIPRRGGVISRGGPLDIPPRRLPPGGSSDPAAVVASPEP